MKGFLRRESARKAFRKNAFCEVEVGNKAYKDVPSEWIYEQDYRDNYVRFRQVQQLRILIFVNMVVFNDNDDESDDFVIFKWLAIMVNADFVIFFFLSLLLRRRRCSSAPLQKKLTSLGHPNMYKPKLHTLPLWAQRIRHIQLVKLDFLRLPFVLTTGRTNFSLP